MSTETTVSRLPRCDVHDGEHDATVDGRTVMGPWANMCDEAHRQLGVGLGTGKGQRLIVRA